MDGAAGEKVVFLLRVQELATLARNPRKRVIYLYNCYAQGEEGLKGERGEPAQFAPPRTTEQGDEFKKLFEELFVQLEGLNASLYKLALDVTATRGICL